MYNFRKALDNDNEKAWAMFNALSKARKELGLTVEQVDEMCAVYWANHLENQDQ